MLPDIQAQERAQAFGNGIILPAGRGHGQFARGVQHKPGPAGTEAFESGLRELFPEFRIIAEGELQPVHKVRGGLIGRPGHRRGRSHHRPEHGMVQVAAAVVANRRTDILRYRTQVADEVLQAFFREFGVLVQGLVQFVHVRLVVLGVVYLHRARVDMRLERVVGVGQGEQFVLHVNILRLCGLWLMM